MRVLILAASLAALALPAAAADRYAFDPAHTEVRASWDHLGLSRQSLEFLTVEGEILFDQETVANSGATVTIAADSVHTGFAKFDEHIRGAEFFDTASHPEITFVSTAARKTGETTGELDGDLTIKGVTRPVTLAVTFRYAGKHPLDGVVPALKGVEAAGFQATTTVNRSDFGLGAFVPAVSDAVEIVIDAEFRKL